MSGVESVWHVCHTILVTDGLADADAGLVVGVLKYHNLGQLDTQTVVRIVLAICASGRAYDGMFAHRDGGSKLF